MAIRVSCDQASDPCHLPGSLSSAPPAPPPSAVLCCPLRGSELQGFGTGCLPAALPLGEWVLVKPPSSSKGLPGSMAGVAEVAVGPERHLREEITNSHSWPEMPELAGVGPVLPFAFPSIVPTPLPGILLGEGGAPGQAGCQKGRQRRPGSALCPVAPLSSVCAATDLACYSLGSSVGLPPASPG